MLYTKMDVVMKEREQLKAHKGNFHALRNMLTEHGIDWHDNSGTLMDRTQGEWNGHFFSAIHGYGSYGGEDGYLEVRIDETEPIGWLTAEEALDLIAGNITYEEADQRAARNYSKALNGYLAQEDANDPSEALSEPTGVR